MKAEIFVDGMMCANCKATVEKAIKKTKGVKSAIVNLATKKASIEFDENKIDIESITKNIEKEGYSVFGVDRKDEYEEKLEKENVSRKKKLFASMVFTIIEFYASMGPMINLPFFFYKSNHHLYVLIQILLTIPVIIINLNLFKKGFFNLFRFHPSMESLVAVGCSASFIYSMYLFIEMVFFNGTNHHYYFESCAVILFLIQLGKYFENRSLNKANSTIKLLLNKTPKTVISIIDGKEVVKDVNEVKVNEILIAKPGDSIAVDGEVVEGISSINESMLTGESMPVDKIPGNKVYAGTNNIDGVIKYRALLLGKDTMVSKIIKMVEDAQSSKAPIEKLADKVSGVFTKVILSISLITFIVWMIIENNFAFALEMAVSVLVIACPCALGLATPTAIIVGSGVGAKNNILYKNAETLETLGKIDTFCFDKTGTLTKGKFVVNEIYLENNDEKILDYIYSLESNSNHLIANSICDKLSNRNKLEVTNYEEIAGFGPKGKIDNHIISIYKSSEILDTNLKSKADKLSNEGNSVVCVNLDNSEIGLIALSDEIKDDAKILIDNLHKRNINVIMLTGDNEVVANSIAKKLNIDKVYANVLPINKSSIIKEIKEKNNVVMVGDGINDAVALSEANVSITFASSTDIALSSSSVIITSDKLTDILVAIDLSKKTLRHIKQNLFFAFFYNSIGVSLACGLFYSWLGIKLNPMIGALAMSFSSVSVVTNALRINLFKKGKYYGN